MGAFLLNENSVILCPHGGVVTHIPITFTTYRIEGRRPMLLTDEYMVQGCPGAGGPMGGCIRVQWVSGSTMLLVKGIPVLTQTSVGLCQTSAGVAAGPAIIASTQLMVREPDEFTSVDQ
jgi:hypothetical protein